jgi:hypothetical protein
MAKPVASVPLATTSVTSNAWDRLSAWLSLFTSTGTLVCCALPALMVSLGAGAALAGLVSAVPALILLSEYKEWVFGVGAVMLALGGVAQWRGRFAPCPIDRAQRDACLKTRRVSAWVYGVSVALFATGVFFAFVLPCLTE